MTVELFRNARIYTPIDNGVPARGANQGKLAIYEHGAMAVKDGFIETVGNEPEVLHHMEGIAVDTEMDCKGRCLIPGFVDPHTHLCFANLREAEFEMRIQGTPYLDILNRGGGILSSVKAVAQADESGPAGKHAGSCAHGDATGHHHH